MAAAVAVLLGSAAGAQVTVVPATPQVGSSNPATAEPPVTRPSTTPCVVQLFQNLQFADFNLKSFSYAPPAACPGPWAKVVFTADFTVTAGRQFDRTAAFYLGHANIYYGTTAEPRRTLSPSWHVERDVTDLSPIFQSAQTGEANIGNFVGVSGGVTYDGIIFANAALEFYPANVANPAPRTPDIVVPVNGPGGDAGTLSTTASEITQTLNLPRNVESAYLDVIAQSQSNDEFWYTCVPNNETGPLQSCGNTAFRETEVSIDGQPAGVAPVYPWIYTGGIDPYLWEPIPGIQTLDFVPYRVDLTPFAGVLSDGNPHTVGVSVYNANSYFLATANLLVYTDHGGSTVTGGVLSNTLGMPTPMVEDNVTSPSAGVYTGTVDTTASRSFTISGYVNTSHGRVQTTVNQTVSFANDQNFTINDTQYIQDITQNTSLDSATLTKSGGITSTSGQHFRYPLTVDITFAVNPDGSFYQTTTAGQGFQKKTANATSGVGAVTSSIREDDQTTDTLSWDANGSFLGPSNSTASQSYVGRNSLGGCYSRTITAAAQKLTSVTDGQGCGQ
ncbi:MAG TPA: peptide-N4-asparagine amidase [Acidobacteriaceae bacterium]|nr:peptide-N4-asparagine amidase [Acidobacteriaceae bacterium]